VHHAAHYLANLFPAAPTKTYVESYVLKPADCAVVTTALPIDASNYYYSACMSVVDGLRAVDAGFYTWSAVKMYYSVYYALRAVLAWDNVAIFRVAGTRRTPFHVNATPGKSPVFSPGRGSHQSLLNSFRALRPNDLLLSQPIDQAADGLGWLLEKREEANYVIPRFCEPTTPEHFEQIRETGIRRAISAYLDPANIGLAFDKDHAIVSFPLLVLRTAGTAAKAHGGAKVGEHESQFLRTKARERNSVLSPLVTFINGTVA
jgi:hypothetical protein